MPSSTATRLIGRLALTSATARARNSAGYGLGMIGAFQNRPDPQSPEVTNPWGRSDHGQGTRVPRLRHEHASAVHDQPVEVQHVWWRVQEGGSRHLASPV